MANAQTPAGTPEIVLIAAVAQGGVIGKGNTLLWRIPEDARHFRQTTAGHAVIMGRKTWDSLPDRFRPLPGRRNIVVTRQAQWQSAGAEAVGSLAAALQLVADAGRVFVIGGAELYATALPLAHTLILTKIDAHFDGDAYFPAFDPQQFRIVESTTQTAAAPPHFPLRFVTYQRIP